MRILISILLFLCGCGLLAYSYIAPFVLLAGDLERSENFNDASKPVTTFLDYLMRGEIPQIVELFYGGAFVIAVSVVLLIVRGKPGAEEK